MKLFVTGIIASIAIACSAMPAFAIEVMPTVDGNDLVNTILGPGIQILPETISLQGMSMTAGMFTAGASSGLDMDAGILIRTGPEAAQSGFGVLEFDFISETQDLYFNYLLASEEYTAPEAEAALEAEAAAFAEGYYDIVKLYVDGENVALLPGTATSVALNTVNLQKNPAYFRDNSGSEVDIGYSGFTRTLTASALDLEPGSHHFKLLIMNRGDLSKHSALFLEAGTFTGIGLKIDDVIASEEAGTMTFTVKLSGPIEQPVNFAYATHDDTATVDSDYSAVSGTSMIGPGSETAQITVNIVDDVLNEPDESFVVELSDLTHVLPGKLQGIGTIFDNEGPPVLAISDASAEELDQKMTFTLNLSSPSSQEISVEYSTVDETAVADEDYTATQGTLTIPAGKDSGSIEVKITLDELRDEGDEIFFVALSNPVNAVLQNEQVTGTIQNTSGSFINRALGRPLPEPSTYMLFLLGLLGLGWLARRRR